MKDSAGGDMADSTGVDRTDRAEDEVAALLERVRDGDLNARERLFSIAYEELRSLAGRQMAGERRAHTLTPTALVHEACLRLLPRDSLSCETREQFLLLAAQAMRRVLVDHARARNSWKRGGRHARVPLASDGFIDDPVDPDLVALDEALDALSRADERKCRVVELRYFAGLTGDETARTLGVSPATVDRDWEVARLWLFHRLRECERGV